MQARALKNNVRWPAEWETHEATWMAFPCRQEIWLNGLEKAQKAFANVANTIADFEPVKMLVRPELIDSASRLLSRSIEIIPMSMDDSWTRDTAPIWLKKQESLVGLNFQFNAWGEKFWPYDQDQKVAEKINRVAGTDNFNIELILEGGAVHTNGQGVILTTEECLLNPNRNSQLNQHQIEKQLLDIFGASQVIWLSRGLSGDVDTDGHIDNIACFVDESLILSQHCPSASENFCIYETNKNIVAKSGLELFTIAEPEPRYFDGQRVPLSYINFYIANGLVVIPKFGCVQDSEAMSEITNLFPDRKVIAVDANEILIGGGGIHCITMQQPKLC
ncbi:agmatine deiminase family protein [Aliikangiella marina]|uniref:Agmatine deiminase family protein n=1 Tax=Aliikangiella marina TaxID=1712262 RepID=A0A545T717_9GAMM|nr:agmatine deiminase family protein [Aliikangiella marina]TQV72972.1 agmatine deiminase family protein [Aliikangiella marina]